MTAGLYNSRARLNVVLLEKLAPGGQVITTDWVENYPGFPDGVSGFELMDSMKRQAEQFGLILRGEEASPLELSGKVKVVHTPRERLETRSVIISTGATWKKLDIEGEDFFIGKGVSYCATCDGPFYRDQEVAVVGGGDTAVEEAIFLTRFASKVHLIHRRDSLRATKLLQERAMAEEKIEIIWDSVPEKIDGNSGVEAVALRNVKTGRETEKKVQGIFVFIGTIPNTEFLQGQLDLDESGFIITNDNMETSIPGVFAAGDVRSKLFRQIATAVGEGAVASFAAEKYLENLES